MPELKPCPFCGAKAAVLSHLCDEGMCGNFENELCPAYEKENAWGCPVFIVCNRLKGGCGASTGWYDNMEKLLDAWNRRANDA